MNAWEFITCKKCLELQQKSPVGRMVCDDCLDHLGEMGSDYQPKGVWIQLALVYPPFDKPVLVSDGESCQIRTLKYDGKAKYWSTDHKNNMKFSASYWMPLPELPPI